MRVVLARFDVARFGLYDTTGSYDVVWWIAVALGVLAALVNLPIRERAILRPAAA